MNLIGYSDDNISQKEQVSEINKDWNTRVAMRGVLIDKEGKVALMHIGKYGIYKLPGGGVDKEEKLEEAFTREILEETGCDVLKTRDLGMFIERRDEWKLFQISFCYIAEVLYKGELNLTNKEKEEGFSLVWADDLKKASELVGQNQSDRYDDKYIKIRDSSILKRAISELSKA